MKLLIDAADIEKIRELYRIIPIDGVTTNPSILAKNGRQPYETLRAIREFIGQEAELHVQVAAVTAEGMLKDALRIQKELGENTYVKIPAVEEGLKAMQLLGGKANVTATAVYTPMQAFLAGKTGARYAAPYVNRIDNLCANGVSTAKEIHDIFKKNGLPTEVLAASFKNSQQVLELCGYGVGACTVSPEVIGELLKNDSVTMAVAAFTKDFEGLCGRGRTMEDCE